MARGHDGRDGDSGIRGPAVDFYLVEVALEAISDEAERERLMSIPTSGIAAVEATRPTSAFPVLRTHVRAMGRNMELRPDRRRVRRNWLRVVAMVEPPSWHSPRWKAVARVAIGIFASSGVVDPAHFRAAARQSHGPPSSEDRAGSPGFRGSFFNF